MMLSCFISSITFAQEWEIAMNGGAVINTVPQINGKKPTAVRGCYLGSGFAGSLKLMYRNSNWSAGVAIDVLPLSYQYLSGTTPLTNESQKTTINIAQPAIPVKLLANRMLAAGRMEPYIGVSAGMLFAKCVPGMKEPANTLSSTATYGLGYTAGLQMGNTFYLSNKVGINGTFSFDYIYLKTGNIQYSLFAFPINFGLRYKI